MNSLLKKIILAVLLMYMSSSYAYENEINNLAENLVDQSENKTIAVLDFQRLDGEKTELGRLFAEEISTELVKFSNSGKSISVFDRLSLENLLKEQKLSTTGLIDPETTKQIGKLTGVDLIVLGTIAKLGEEFKVTAKLLDIETAKNVDSFKVSVPVTESLNDLYFKSSGVSINQSSKSEINVKFPVSQVAEKGGVELAMQSCTNETDHVVCKLLLTSLKKDRDVRLGNNGSILKTNILDQAGDSYLSKNLCFNNYCYDHDYVDQFVFSDVPVSVVYRIPIGDNTKSIAYLSVVYQIEKKHYKVSFSNIKL